MSGMSLPVSDVRITIGGDVSTPSAKFTVAIDMWPQWLRVAAEHQFKAETARDAILASVSAADRSNALAEEMRAGMVTVSAAAFALEALALSAALRVPSVASVGSNASTGKRVAETIRQCFDLPGKAFPDWRKSVIQIFDARNWAVHPDAGFALPRSHPALNASVPPPAHIYRLENSQAAVRLALHTAKFCSEHAKARYKDLKAIAAAWQQYVAELEVIVCRTSS
jgi:hypothetical protein